MPDLLFDKLVFKDRLTHAGVPEEHARAHADAIDEALREAVVTKPFLRAELTAVRSDLQTQLTAVRGDLQTQLTATRSDLQTQLAQLETRLTLRFGAITAAGVAVLLGVKFFG